MVHYAAGTAEASAYTTSWQNKYSQPEFYALTTQAAGSQPLYRVYSGWTQGFPRPDVLEVGAADYQYIQTMDLWPQNALTWTGMSGPGTVVIEALNSGCPDLADIAATNLPTATDGDIVHSAWTTIASLFQLPNTPEVFVNGQYNPSAYTGGTRPQAIARSIVQITPAQPTTGADFLADFEPGSTAANEVFAVQNPSGWGGWGASAFLSAHFDARAYSVFQASLGVQQGQLWAKLSDEGADTNGKLRMTALQKATMQSSSFLHVTMDVTSFTDGRLYPQILISDQNIPVQDNMSNANAHTLNFETIGDNASILEVQLCDNYEWDVNLDYPVTFTPYSGQQCPGVYSFDNPVVAAAPAPWASPTPTLALTGVPTLNEHLGLDKMTHWDVYASTQQAFVFLDNQPYGCVEFAPGAAPQGNVTVTWGQSLYHTGVAQWPFSNYLESINGGASQPGGSLKVEPARRYDNLSYTSGTAAPSWNFSKFPCQPPVTVFTNQPGSQNITSGTSVTLTAQATGAGGVTYQWYTGTVGDYTFNSSQVTAIPGATSATYTTPPLTASAMYWVMAKSNTPVSYSGTAIAPSLLAVNNPVIQQQPQNLSISSGSTATFTVGAYAEYESGLIGDTQYGIVVPVQGQALQGITAYQWYSGSSGDTSHPIQGATSASYTTPALTSPQSYWVQVTSQTGATANSTTATATP